MIFSFFFTWICESFLLWIEQYFRFNMQRKKNLVVRVYMNFAKNSKNLKKINYSIYLQKHLLQYLLKTSKKRCKCLWITKEELLASARLYGKSPYGEHLKRVADNRLVYEGGNV